MKERGVEQFGLRLKRHFTCRTYGIQCLWGLPFYSNYLINVKGGLGRSQIMGGTPRGSARSSKFPLKMVIGGPRCQRFALALPIPTPPPPKVPSNQFGISVVLFEQKSWFLCLFSFLSERVLEKLTPTSKKKSTGKHFYLGVVVFTGLCITFVRNLLWRELWIEPWTEKKWFQGNKKDSTHEK